MADRASRIQDLQDTAKDYIKSERTRAENEVKSLDEILKGRTGGQGIQAVSVAVVASVANKDLEAYLKEK
jgi:hypothetical protein